MLDLVNPERPNQISLADLKRKSRLTNVFFDTFFNLDKYLDHEQKDPFATGREEEDGMSDWDRFAAEEYEMLVAEEGGSTAAEQPAFFTFESQPRPTEGDTNPSSSNSTGGHRKIIFKRQNAQPEADNSSHFDFSY